MMTNTAPATAPRRAVLLIKAQGDFKHSGKYFLHNGRWHKLHADKPVPKGAPVAVHPQAAGKFVPKQHLSDAEWAQLKLPAENTNAGSYNKLLDVLKQHSDAGDVTAILGMQFGTNTYGKKGAAVANHLLGLYGSEHKVAPGQKAGEHAAVSQAPAETPAPKAAEPAPKEEPAAEKLAPDAPAEKPVASGLSMPAFVEGKTTQGVTDYYAKQAQKIIDMAAAGDADGLAKMKADGLKPNSKGKVGNTFKGKTENSKLLLALHDQAVDHVGKKVDAVMEANPPAAELTPAADPVPDSSALAPTAEPAPAVASSSKVSQIPWDSLLLPDSNKNAKSHNGKVAQIKAMAEAGDIAGLEAFKAGTNTYGKKQNLLAQTALAALKEDAAAPAPAVAPIQEQSDAKIDQANAAGKMTRSIQNAINEAIEEEDGTSLKYFMKEYAEGTPVHEAAKAGLAKLNEGSAPVAPAPADDLPESQKKLIDDIAKWPDGKSHLKDIIENGTPASIAYAKQLLSSIDQSTGPQEGDTKQGADGMLVFKNGRWHKQEQAKAAEPAPASASSGLPEVPQFSSVGGTASWAANYQKVAQALHDAVIQHGAAGLKGVVVSHGDGRFTINAGGFKLKKVGPNDKQEYRKQMHAYVAALKAAVGKPKKAASKPKAAAPVYADNGIQSMDSWKQTGPQGGSNPGGKFKDENGVEWYCKFPSNEDVAKSEVLAAQLYAISGVAGQDAKLVMKDGKLGIASRWVTVNKASPAELAKTKGVLSGFGVDAWLGNWDVVGLGFDNLQVNEKGEAVRVDAGGSLTYRAQGGKKAFGTTVSEIDSLRDPKINPQSSAVFGKMTDADITAAVAKVLAIPDAAIINAVELHGPGDAANKKALADVLLARKADLAAKFPKAAKPPKKRLDPNNLPVNADRLPKAHDFTNWLGAGKPLSSQPHVNAANMAVEQEMLALAKTGNLNKLKDFKFHAIDKATGNATGQLIPIAEHPSKHVVQLHADLVMTLDEIANPPEPLKVFQETDVGTIEQLAAALPPKKFGTTVAAVKSNEKLGFWVVLGTAHGAAQKLKPEKVMDYSKAAIDAAYVKFQQASHLAKHFIKSVQASGSYNDLFRDGKTHDHSGNKLSDVAKAAMEHATSMPEGTSVYRWQAMPDDMVKKVLDAPDGTVFQATGPMCTSYSQTGTSGFGKHRVTIRYAKGAKAVESFASGSFKGEKEITTLPNARFVILKKEMVPDVEHNNPSGKRLELELLMLPPDLGL